MRYFSQLKGKKVLTGENTPVGKLWDFLFLATDLPLLTKLVVKVTPEKRIMIPIEFLQRISNDELIISKDYTESELGENELYLNKNLLDKQIIDVLGSKVVRVNDVAIQDREGKGYYVAGVDIGLRGILRWLNLENAVMPMYRLLHLQSHPHFLSWADIQPLELARGNVQLKKDLENLERMHPEDLADYLEKTTIKNVNKIISHLDENYAADVIEDLNVNYQTALFRRFSPERAAKLIDLIDPDDAVDILLTLTNEKREEILASVSPTKRKKLQTLMKLSKTPIGELLTTEYLTVFADDTVGKVHGPLKEKISGSIFSFYVYVLNKENQLVGILTIDRLYTEPSDKVISNIMQQDVAVVHLTTPIEIAIKKMLRYKVYAMPVIDNDKQILGIITLDDVAEDILEEL